MASNRGYKLFMFACTGCLANVYSAKHWTITANPLTVAWKTTHNVPDNLQELPQTNMRLYRQNVPLCCCGLPAACHADDTKSTDNSHGFDYVESVLPHR